MEEKVQATQKVYKHRRNEMLLSVRRKNLCEMKLLFFVLCVGVVYSAKLPEQLKRCHQKDENLNECVRQSVTDAIRKMANGLPSLGIGPLEPLSINEIRIGTGSNSPVSINQDYKNIKLGGLTNSVLTTYNAQLDKYRLYTESVSPLVEFLADYEMNGRVLVLPVQGKGAANISLVELKSTHDLIGEPFKKKGKTYMRLTEYKFTMEPKRVYFDFQNLFNGDELLGRTTLAFFNEHWKDIFDEIKPQYETSFGLVFKEISNRIFTKVPFDEIFLEN